MFCNFLYPCFFLFCFFTNVFTVPKFCKKKNNKSNTSKLEVNKLTVVKKKESVRGMNFMQQNDTIYSFQIVSRLVAYLHYN